MLRESLRRILQVAERLSAAAFLCIPLAILLLGLALYLLQLVQTVLAPGVPIEYTYEVKGKPYRLRARSYTIDLESKRAILTGVQLSDPKKALAQLDWLSVSILPGRFDVRARDGWVLVQRLPGDRFSIADAFPEQSSDEPPSAFKFRGSNLTAAYTDASKAPSLSTRLTAESIDIDSGGNALRAEATLRLANQSRIQLAALWDKEKVLNIDLTTNQAEIGSLLPHLGRWLPDAEPLRANTLAVSGAGKIRLVGKQEPEWTGNFRVQGTGVRWPEYAEGARMQASTVIRDEMLHGRIELTEPGRSTQFTGFFAWRDRTRNKYELALQGDLTAKSDSVTRLWKPLRNTLPKDLSWTKTEFNGSVTLNGARYDLGGKLVSDRIRYAGEEFRAATGQLRTTSEGLWIAINKATYQDAQVAGAVLYRYKGGQLAGNLETLRPVSVNRLAARAGLEGATGRASAQFLLSGTAAKPVITARVQGSGRIKVADQVVDARRFIADAELKGDRLDLRRVIASGAQGTVAATGNLNLKSKQLALDVQASGLELQQWTGEYGGKAFVKGKVAGTFDQPVLIGQAQVFGLQAGEVSIPISKADLRVDRQTASLQNINAEALASRFQGDLQYSLKSGGLQGSFRAKDLQLADVQHALGLAGDISLDQVQLGGTADNPLVRASLSSRRAAFQGYKFTDSKAELTYAKNEIVLSSASFTVGDGKATVSGRVSSDGQRGELQLEAKDLNLASLLRGDATAAISGRVSSKAAVAWAGNKLSTVDSLSQLTGLEADGVPLGSGEVTAKLDNKLWTGRAQVGDLQRYLIAENIRYDEANDVIGGKIDLFNFEIANLLQSKTLSKVIDNETAERTLQSLSGQLTASVELGGSGSSPDFMLPLLEINNFAIAGRPAGTIKGTADRKVGLTKIDRLEWRADQTIVNLKGTIGQQGELALAPSVERFDSSWIQALFHEASVPRFEAGIDLEVTGTLSNPVVEGASREIAFDLGTEESTARPVVLLDTINLAKGVWTLGGQLSVADFSGRLTGRIPMSAFAPGSRNFEPLSARFDLKPRSIDEFTGLLPNLDPQRSDGTLQGFVTVDGSPGDLRFGGEVSLSSKSLGFTDIETTLSDITAKVGLDRNQLRLLANGTSSAGGALKADIAAIVPTAIGADFNLKNFLSQSPVSGTVTASQLAVREKPNSRDRRLIGVLEDGDVKVSGFLNAPVIAGSLTFRDVDVVVPELAESQGTFEPVINPIFRSIALNLKNTARVRTSAATIDLTGAGLVNGTLTAPVVDATMKVVDGTFSLPTARVRLEEGGTVRLRYDGNLAVNSASLNLDMEGRTSVNARRVSDTVERYDVTLRITGDLLQVGGLNIVASSDPPDLTSQEILGLLGQKDLIETLARSTIGSGQRDQFRDAALTLALPSLTGGIGQGIASSFGLDYFGLEYNAFDQTVVSAAKTLGKNFTVSARRSLSNDVRGRPRYGVQVSWRIPSRDRFLSRMRLGFGFDQDRPWRVSLDYVKRF